MHGHENAMEFDCMRREQFDIGKRLLVLSVVVIFSGCFDSVGSSDPGNPPDIPSDSPQENPSEEYVLVWSDEFNAGSSPSLARWRMETGYGVNGWGNDEWQNYTHSSDNVHQEDGALVLSAQCPSGVCGKRDGSITSARITTKEKFSVKYGKIQARIKTPSGQGTWSAFWMLGDNIDSDGWPKSGEIDIMEMYYRDSDIYTTHSAAHWWVDDPDAPGHVYTSNYRTFSTPLTDDYHVYEVEWDNERILGKIDGVIYYKQLIDQESMGEFLNDFFLNLNVAVGGTLGGDIMPTSWPQNMYVDYVRVYQKKPEPTKVVYSEAKDADTQNYIRIIDSNEWYGNNVAIDPISTSVAALDGKEVLAANYTLSGTNAGGDAGWGGLFFQFARDDWSNQHSLVFGLNKSAMMAFDSLEIKIEDGRGGDFSKSVMLASYTYQMSENWAVYSIPFKDFTGIDFSDVVYLGFINPIDVNDTRLAGTLYFDDIHLATENCAVDGAVSFNEASYPEDSTQATVTVTDECGANKGVVVLIDNGIESIGLGMKLNAAGIGSSLVNFGPTEGNTKSISIANGNELTAKFTDKGGNERTVKATVTAGAPRLDGDDDGDGAVYLYATDPNIHIDLEGNGTDFSVVDWDSGSVYESAYTADTDYRPVFEVVSGGGWGAPAAAVAFTGFTRGFSSNYTTLNFKIRGLPSDSVFIKFASAGDPQTEVAFPLADYAKDITGTTGWKQVTIPLTLYSERSSYTEFSIHGGWNNGGTFYFTDLYFN